MLVLGPCRCQARQAAQRTAFFLYSVHFGGWVFPDDARRVTFAKERWRGTTADHSGEPYVWHACPWCGGDLEDDGQADGGS